MNVPWKGAAEPLAPDAFAVAAALLDVEEAALRAVWEVESASRAYEPDGTLTRRFEPHHCPAEHHAAIGWHGGGWRDALKLPRQGRRQMFEKAWQVAPEAALRATSWGGPQIMGFNAEIAGYSSAGEMVEAMAASEHAQLEAFCSLVNRKGLATHLRAHDWESFARGYNGNGQAAAYGRKIEAAWRRWSGQKSPVVLRRGDRGADVRRLQRLLRDLGHGPLLDDGRFGAETERAVRDFQAERDDLLVDGVVGARTWRHLERAAREKAPPGQAVNAPAQPDTFDAGLKRVRDVSTTVTVASGAFGGLWEGLGETERLVVLSAAGAAAVIAVGVWAVLRLRRVR